MAFLLYGRSAAQLEKYLAHRIAKRSVHRATAGTFVASAAETGGNLSDVKLTFAAQAYSKTSVGNLAKEGRHFDPTDRKHVVDQPLAVFFKGSAFFHLLLRHPGVA